MTSNTKDTGFEAFGKPVPEHRVTAARSYLFTLLNPTGEKSLTINEKLTQTVKAIEKDRPDEAFNIWHTVIDRTGIYRLISILCTHEVPVIEGKAPGLDLSDLVEYLSTVTLSRGTVMAVGRVEAVQSPAGPAYEVELLRPNNSLSVITLSYLKNGTLVPETVEYISDPTTYHIVAKDSPTRLTKMSQIKKGYTLIMNSGQRVVVDYIEYAEWAKSWLVKPTDEHWIILHYTDDGKHRNTNNFDIQAYITAEKSE